MLSKYQSFLDQKILSPDPAQRGLAARLDKLQQEIHQWQKSERGFFFKKQRDTTPQGLYVHGGVGQGKTMLMDLFFETLDTPRKTRMHFHHFMRDIHRALHQFRKKKTKDPLLAAAEKIVPKHSVLCFDEFQVHDIADAMILERLFRRLWENNVVIVATSNIPPSELYKDGLKRDNFLPFITLLDTHINSYVMAAKQDYRLGRLQALHTVYFTPLGPESEAFLAESFTRLTSGVTVKKQKITISGRHITLDKTASGVAWTDFNHLCKKALAAADYIELARSFHSLLLADIPLLTPEDHNETLRFIHLIDALYEHHVKLICTAAAPANQLCTKGRLATRFERTVSRLEEMTSQEYLHLAHVG